MSMNRGRVLPPDIFKDEDLIPLDPLVRMTGVGLRLHADDEGRESTTLWNIRANVWPGNPEFTDEVLIEHLLLLDQTGYIGIYSVGDRTFYQVRQWPAVSHPYPSKIPAPPLDLFRNHSRTPPESFSAWESGSGERAGEGEPAGRAGLPPSPFCKVHQPNGTLDDCRHCGTARLAHQQFVDLRRAEVAP